MCLVDVKKVLSIIACLDTGIGIHEEELLYSYRYWVDMKKMDFLRKSYII